MSGAARHTRSPTAPAPAPGPREARSPGRLRIPVETDHPFRSMPITDSSPMPITFGVGTGTVGGV